MNGKYPNCGCGTTKYDYFRKRYRNGTLHLMRKCGACGKVAINPMRQQEYDKAWVDGLPIVENGVVVSTPAPEPAPERLSRPSRLSKAAQLQAKLENHIARRNAKQRSQNERSPISPV